MRGIFYFILAPAYCANASASQAQLRATGDPLNDFLGAGSVSPRLVLGSYASDLAEAPEPDTSSSDNAVAQLRQETQALEPGTSSPDSAVIRPHHHTHPVAADSETAAPGTEGAPMEKDEASWAPVDTADVHSDATSLGAVVDSQGRVRLQSSDGDASKFVAWGSIHDRLDDVGWVGLSMHTSESGDVKDGMKMYAAGVLEGFMSAERIREFHDNSRSLVNGDLANRARLPKLKASLGGMVSRLTEKVKAEDAEEDAFVTQSRLAFLQTWGIRDGYAAATRSSQSLQDSGAQPLSMVDIFILNSDGVIDELFTAYGGDADAALLQRSAERRFLRSSFAGIAAKPLKRRMSLGHCTGLVHLADSNEELYFGHTTWESFSEMTRFWKVYDFPVQGAAARKISFSSYPGCVSSTDDYYLMDSGLAVTETTLNIPKDVQYSPSGEVPDFIRIMAANRVASTGRDWVQSMSDSATGTYSSQWMVVDYKKFKKGQSLEDGTFHVLEQAPGMNHIADMSSHLQDKRYWASYDRAYFDDTRAATGDDDAMGSAKYSPKSVRELFSKNNTPRAQIIQKTIGGVNSLDAMRSEMSENKGTEEPVDEPKLRTPSYAISARNDLRDADTTNPRGIPDGGVDSKVTSSCLFQSLAAEAISSPSHSTDKPFKWKEDGKEVFPGYPHEGLPDEPDFDWMRMDANDNVVGPLDGGGCQ